MWIIIRDLHKILCQCLILLNPWMRGEWVRPQSFIITFFICWLNNFEDLINFYWLFHSAQCQNVSTTTEGVIIGDVHKFFCQCLIPLDPCWCSYCLHKDNVTKHICCSYTQIKRSISWGKKTSLYRQLSADIKTKN